MISSMMRIMTTAPGNGFPFICPGNSNNDVYLHDRSLRARGIWEEPQTSPKKNVFHADSSRGFPSDYGSKPFKHLVLISSYNAMQRPCIYSCTGSFNLSSRNPDKLFTVWYLDLRF
jgi:hypothetical protein